MFNNVIARLKRRPLAHLTSGNELHTFLPKKLTSSRAQGLQRSGIYGHHIARVNMKIYFISHLRFSGATTFEKFPP